MMNDITYTCNTCGMTDIPSERVASMHSVGNNICGPVKPASPPTPDPKLVKMALQNVTRAFKHLPDDQLCGIWIDGSALCGRHIKQLFVEFVDTVCPPVTRRPDCENGDCRDHYGDEAAWCAKCARS